ncbi:arginine decarboxylase, pyruvoyl-dependent [Candidatus Micrarchaeota archaeon]|nr:arginine decarboxylase, pyruvoyl-dependent [Candidatus Micrarchaeota archaeon]
MENLVPKKMFLTKGVGKDVDPLSSFERALKDAGIERCNLVNVSSILPPDCEIIPKEKGVELLKPGQITFVVMSRNSCNEPNRLMSASIGVAIPADKSAYGYLSEYHSFGETDEKAGDKAEDLAASMLASTLGVDFDMGQSWDEKEQLFKLSGKIVRTRNAAQSTIVDKDGMWRTVLAAAVLLLE